MASGRRQEYARPAGLSGESPPRRSFTLYSLCPCRVSQILRGRPRPALHTCELPARSAQQPGMQGDAEQVHACIRKKTILPGRKPDTRLMSMWPRPVTLHAARINPVVCPANVARPT